MRSLILFLLCSIAYTASAQIDTAHYLIKPQPTVMRTDTLANNLLTYNQLSHQAELMNGGVLTNYFRKGLALKTRVDSIANGQINITGYAKSGQLATVATSGSYNDLINKPSIPTSLTAGSNISIVGNAINNTAPDQTVTLTAGNGIQITGTYPNFTISQIAPTISTPTRSFNSNYTISTTKPAFVFYTVTCSVTNPLVVGTSTASCFLEYSTNDGSTWNSVASIANSSGVGVTVTVQLTNGQTGIVGGVIPVNALTRLRTTTSGTASLTFVSAQEIIY